MLKIGDIVQIKPSYRHVYSDRMKDQMLLITDITTTLHGEEIYPIAVVLSGVGIHSFPVGDMEIIPEVLELDVECAAMSMADYSL